MTTRSQYYQLTKAPGETLPYRAGCALCGWARFFTSDRKARSAWLGHDCVRELPDLPAELEDVDWQHRARCLQHDPETFFEPDTYNEAIVICNGCPVRTDCLYTAMREERHRLKWGVRAGLLPEERAALEDISRG